MIVVLHYVSEGRRAGYDCCSALCVRGKTCGFFFVRWWEHHLLGFVSLSAIRCSFPMQGEWGYWFVGIGLVLVGLCSCRSGHLLVWLLVGLGTYRTGYLSAWVLVGLGSCGFGQLLAWVPVGHTPCWPYSTQASQAWVVVELRGAW